MNNVPSSRINYIAHHIRTLRFHDDAIDPWFTGLEYVNQLKELDIPQQSWSQYEFENACSVKLQKRLVRTNSEGLRGLAWHGYGIEFQPAYFDMEDFVGFKQLTFLQLHNWFGGEGLLARVLDNVAGTVEVLQLYLILGILPGAFNLDDQADDAVSLWTAMTSEEPREPRRLRRLALPRVVTLKFTVEGGNGGMVELVACCPNLQRLSFTPFREADAVKVAEDIEECGLKNLRSLTVKNEARNLDGVQCAKLLQSCMEASKEPTTSIKTAVRTPGHGEGGRGLVKINISPERLENEARLVSRIVLHADTLRSLKLTLCGAFEVMPENFLPQILYQCHNLEVFQVKVEKVQFDLFKALGPSSGPWACRGLRKFIFSAVEYHIPELEIDEEEEDEDEHGVGALSAGRNWFRSWRNKMNKTTDKTTDIFLKFASISSTHPVMGWYKHTSATTRMGSRSQAFETVLLRKVFRMLKSQDLKLLEMLIWNGVPYERSNVPSEPIVKIRLGDHHQP
ncbi:hypothetical protein BGZ97_013173 [Linnemannia gamsii]|uniref:Uncharacterized protein n=1 Tax=Linnemannia gamsii TaxID=64522 RepID=A0A9P6R3K1_9FUNG|nr:hypothetical protein BGZ97_013173 [Linnemannia gamsii]